MKVIIESEREWHLLDKAFEEDIRLEVLVTEIPTQKPMPALISEGRLLLAVSSHKAKRMEWTKDKPTEPGWYWYYEPSNKAPIVALVVDGAPHVHHVYDWPLGFEELPGWWFGPLNSPGAPSLSAVNQEPPPIGADW